MESTSRVLKKFTYADGDVIRGLRGFLVGESEDGLFFIVERPLGDVIWIAKSAVRTVSPVSDLGANR